MKNNYVVLLIASSILFMLYGSAAAQNSVSGTNEDTLFTSKAYTLPIKTEIVCISSRGKVSPTGSKTIYTYNANGLVTSSKAYQENVLSSKSYNYLYEDKQSSYTYIKYKEDGRGEVFRINCSTTFEDTEYKRPLVKETVYTFGSAKKLMNKKIFTYNSQGLEVNVKEYDQGQLKSEWTNYRYEDKKISYTIISYDPADANNSAYRDLSIEFEDAEYKRPIVEDQVDTDSEGDKGFLKKIYTYNANGLLTNCKAFFEGRLFYEQTNYKYEDKKSFYTFIMYNCSTGMTNGRTVKMTTYLY